MHPGIPGAAARILARVLDIPAAARRIPRATGHILGAAGSIPSAALGSPGGAGRIPAAAGHILGGAGGIPGAAHSWAFLWHS